MRWPGILEAGRSFEPPGHADMSADTHFHRLRVASRRVEAEDRGEHSVVERGESVYDGAAVVERVLTELMAAFGYFD